MTDIVVQDIAGKEYWDEQWRGSGVPAAADPEKGGLGNLFVRRMDRLFDRIFEGEPTQGKEFLELGCGSSIWLPYFASRFGFNVTGVDYSENGCAKERAILRNAGVDAEVVRADFFAPPDYLLEKFDFAYSSGVVEHFSPTSECIAAFANFLKPGGKMITLVPNMTGLVGLLQKHIDPEVYDIHMPLTVESLSEAHRAAGLQVVTAEYFLSSGFGIVNSASLDPRRLSSRIKKGILKSLEGISVLTWLFENRTYELPTSQTFSPYVLCLANKPFGEA